MICYKVVLLYEGSGLYSVNILDRLVVRYEIGEWTEAPPHARKMGYHLLAFRTLSEACAFRDFFGSSCPIYECEGLYPVEPLPPSLKGEELRRLMKGEVFEPKTKTKEGSWPEGTVMFKKIKLVRQVG